MACNVCGEENGWAENPLVYCDGNDGDCSVAVHSACYGITSVPSGAWLCGKCISLERKAKVRCELCPNRDGAFKRTNTGNFAHVVCSLYIPEVRFGNVCTMEPIILNSIPSERFHRNCYICEDRGREGKAKTGACMQCNKSGCKQYFHVTCAQAQGLLCEEAGNSDDNVKYCGYCKHHYQKMKKDPHIKFIPAFKPETRSDKHESSPEKKSHYNSDTSKPPKKKQKFYGTTSSRIDSDIEPEKETTKSKRKRTSSNSKDLSSSSISAHNRHSSSKETCSLFGRESSDHSSSESNIMPVNKKSRESCSKSAFDSDTDDEIQYKKSKTTDSDKKKLKKSSKNKDKDEKSIEKSSKEGKKVKKRKEDASSSKATTKSVDKEEISVSKNCSKIDSKKPEEKQPSTKSISHNEIAVEKVSNKSSTVHPETEIVHEDDQLQTTTTVREEMPKQDFDLPEIIKRSSFYATEEAKSSKPILTFEELLERQWNQSAQYLMEQTFDISSLISCLYKLKSENQCLDEKLRNLTQKRDHLISVNSRLAIPLNGLDSNCWDAGGNNQLTSTANNSIATNASTLNKSNETAANLFFNQNALNQQSNFSSSIHNTATQATSTPSPNQTQKQTAGNPNASSNHSNFFNLNCVNNNINSSLNNQSFKPSLDLNSNASFFDSTLKQTTASGNFHFNNGLFQAVNGQFNLTNTSSPSKLNTSFNNSLTSSANNSNLLTPQLFQNFLQNPQAFTQLNQQTVQNSVQMMNGSQSKR